MTRSSNREDTFDSLNALDMLTVNRTCDEFESQWRQNGNVSVSEFVSQLNFGSAELTEAVLCELIAIDVTYRRKHQMDVTAASYHDHFPQLQRETLARLVATSPMTLNTTRPDSSSATQKSHDPPVLSQGQRVGDYLVESQIGHGGMGQVYRATHELMGRKVAIKVLSHSIARDPKATQRFQREVQLLAEMQHANMVTALDARYEDDKLLLVTEWIDGVDLHEYVQTNGVLPVADVLEIAIQVASGLHHAHVKGFVHRDVKPSNLMLDATGNIKILDLGLAKLYQNTEVTPIDQVLTSNHQFIGTAAYLSPEQARDPARVDERTDVYSLGCSLVFLLTGRPPYAGDTAMDTLLQHASAESIDLTQSFRDRSIPRSLSRLIESMLSKSVDQRPRSMMEVRDAFIHIRDQSRTTNRLSDRRRSWMMIACGGVLVFVVILFALKKPFAGKQSNQNMSTMNGPSPLRHDTNTVETGLIFNGDSSYARVIDFDVPPEGSLLIDAVVTPDQGPLPSNIVTWGGPNLLALYVAPNLHWGVASLRSGTSHLHVSEQPFELGATYRVTCLRKEDQLSLWVNGQPIRTRSQMYELTPSDVSLCFGGLPSDLLPIEQGTRYFSGQIHQLSLHRRDLPIAGDHLPSLLEMTSSATVAFNLEEATGQTVVSQDKSYRATLFDCRWIGQ